MFINVDLPAPFSPSSALSRPRRTVICTSSSARTPGNDLQMPRGRQQNVGVGVVGHGFHEH